MAERNVCNFMTPLLFTRIGVARVILKTSACARVRQAISWVLPGGPSQAVIHEKRPSSHWIHFHLPMLGQVYKNFLTQKRKSSSYLFVVSSYCSHKYTPVINFNKFKYARLLLASRCRLQIPGDVGTTGKAYNRGSLT